MPEGWETYSLLCHCSDRLDGEREKEREREREREKRECQKDGEPTPYSAT